jgi:hypothetical protein
MDLNEFDETPYDEEPFPEDEVVEGSSNRAFIIAIGALGAIVVLAIIGIILWVLFLKPPTSAELENQAAQIQAQNTAIALIATQTAEFDSRMATQKAIPSNTPEFPTETPVVAVASPTNTQAAATSVAGGKDPAARTATVAAFQTQAAQAAAGTGTPGATSIVGQLTPTELPTTGFMDDFGLPALVGAAFALIVIIFLARRLRFSSSN